MECVSSSFFFSFQKREIFYANNHEIIVQNGNVPFAKLLHMYIKIFVVNVYLHYCLMSYGVLSLLAPCLQDKRSLKEREIFYANNHEIFVPNENVPLTKVLHMYIKIFVINMYLRYCLMSCGVLSLLALCGTSRASSFRKKQSLT